MKTKSENQFEKINALRSMVGNIVTASGSLNQAVKALAGLEKKYAEACAALGVENLSLKSVCAAWSDSLKIEGEDGKKMFALYLPVQVTVESTDEDGQPEEKNAYERKVNKKGVVSYKALKVRRIMSPEAWTPALIIEGLVQSKELEQAKLEAEVSELHVKNQLKAGVYIKVTEKDEEGGQSIYFERA